MGEPGRLFGAISSYQWLCWMAHLPSNGLLSRRGILSEGANLILQAQALLGKNFSALNGLLRAYRLRGQNKPLAHKKTRCTGVPLVVERNGKIVEILPKYKYVRVPIKKAKKLAKKTALLEESEA